MKPEQRLLVSIPALNEEGSIGEAIQAVREVLQGCEMLASVSHGLILVIDDGSSDKTQQIALEKGALVIRHVSNRGVGAAFHSAVRKALELGVDYLVTIDADLQFDPQDIPKLLQPLLEGRADSVTGSRFSDPGCFPRGIPRVRHFGNLAMSALVSLITGKRFSDVSCGFRAYTRECLLHLNLKGEFTYTQESFIELVAKQVRIEEVPIRVRYFEGRVSRVAGSVLRYGMKTSAIILRALLEYRPLWLLSRVAAVLALVSVALSVPVARNLAAVGAFTPYKFLACISGAILSVAIVLLLTGLVAQRLAQLRREQEYLIYLAKRQAFGSDFPPAND